MKRVIVCLLILSSAVGGWGQGQIIFANFVPAYSIDAPVFDIDCRTRLEGSVYLAQVYVGRNRNSLAPLGPRISFLEHSAAGYFRPVGLAVPDVANAQVHTQLRAWEAAAGPTYEAAVSAGGKHGFSNIVPVYATTGPAPPGSPEGLESFCLIRGMHLGIGPVQIINSRITFNILTSFPERKTAVEVSGNLREWSSLSTVVPSSSSFRFVDPNPLNVIPRFYRVVIQPE